MAPHSSTLAWKIPWMEEPGRLQSMGHKESDTTKWLHFHFSLSCIGEGNGNPLQCSCLENPRDGGAWWAAISGVAQSWTQLKQLSSSSSSSSSCNIRSRFLYEGITPLKEFNHWLSHVPRRNTLQRYIMYPSRSTSCDHAVARKLSLIILQELKFTWGVRMCMHLLGWKLVTV